MSLSSRMLSVAVDRVYAMFGDAAVLSARDCGTRACTVVVDHDLTRYGGTAVVSGKTVVVGVRLCEVPDMPRRGDVFDIETGKFAGRSVTVSDVASSDEFEHKVFAA